MTKAQQAAIADIITRLRHVDGRLERDEETLRACTHRLEALAGIKVPHVAPEGIAIPTLAPVPVNVLSIAENIAASLRK